MIGETQLSYQLSRWTFLALLALAIPLVCIPVRGQEKPPAVPAAPAASDGGAVKAAADNGDKKENRPNQSRRMPAMPPTRQPIDPKIKELGEAVSQEADHLFRRGDSDAQGWPDGPDEGQEERHPRGGNTDYAALRGEWDEVRSGGFRRNGQIHRRNKDRLGGNS